MSVGRGVMCISQFPQMPVVNRGETKNGFCRLVIMLGLWKGTTQFCSKTLFIMLLVNWFSTVSVVK